MIDYPSLKYCPVFKGIEEEEVKLLLKKVHFQIKNFSKNDVIVLAGDKVKNLYIILQGSVSGEIHDYSGNTIKIEDIEAPRPLATAFLFGSENSYPVTLVANTNVTILSLPVDEFLMLLQMNSVLLKNYLNSISSRTQFLSQKLHFLGIKTIKGKIAHFLLQKAGDRYHSVELKSTQQELADLFGVTRPSLARVFSEMQKERLIITERRTITIINKEKLNKLIRK
ncbi:MAG: Crp/Fnr family transcriptional regulator [Bacteroidales bacterium]|jgi:CRP-like cAMP-binding protein|nr:Crp/Fnr family transcriptional regulator [Bacteroidales bacterium]